MNEGDDLTVVQCSNAPGKPENLACANSIIGTSIDAHSIDAHMRYLGVTLYSQCTAYQEKKPFSILKLLAKYNL